MQRKARAISRACDDILKGKLTGEFIVDVFQTGAGTAFPMNVNEVIANRAAEILRGNEEEYTFTSLDSDILARPKARFPRKAFREGKPSMVAAARG